MTSLNQRIKLILQKKQMTGLYASEQLQIDYKQFNNWLNNTKPSIEGLQKIINYFSDLNARWLLTGQGEMINGTGEIPEMVEEPQAEYQKSGCQLCAEKDKQIKLLEKMIELLEGKTRQG